MLKNEYHVVGVMSGTSLDGIDLAYIHFVKSTNWSYSILCAETIAYSELWETRLQDAINLSKANLKELNFHYTEYLSNIISDFITRNDLREIDAICSHGHTILHQPENGFTLQIGNLSKLANLLQQNVVCDFRVQDVVLGGQGAPLVPIGDKLLFSEYDYCLNLGGFANISTENEGQRIAYDICPVNIVMNHYVQQLGYSYDDKGSIAKSGILHEELLKELASLPFYKLAPPKSLGLEWVKANVFPLIDSYDLKTEDILRTFVEHIATQLTREIIGDCTSSVLVTGGGAYNDFLISKVRAMTSVKLVVPEKVLLEYKEALIFGFLGVLKLRNEINVLASVTGAKKDHSSGVVFHYNNSN